MARQRTLLASSLLALALTACQTSNTDTAQDTADFAGAATMQLNVNMTQENNVPYYEQENTGTDCNIAEKIDYADLTEIQELPNPFIHMNGEPVTTASDWRCRRAEISAQMQRWIYGEKPAPTASLSTEASADSITVNLSDNGQSINFTAEIQWPTTGSAPYPALIGIGQPRLNNQQILDMGVAIISFPQNEVGAHSGLESRGQGSFYSLYGEDHSAASTVAWAWGVSRLIDALEQTSELNIDPHRLGLTGCSRNGKGALVTGALDERIVLTIVQESGSGGSAAWRVADAQLASGQNVQTARQIVTENTWLSTDFEQFGESVPKLPVDNHELLALVAPRGLLVLENTGMEWLGNESAWTSALAAREVYKALGVPTNMGVTQVGGHRHCVVPESQEPAVNAFIQRFLLDQPVNTDLVETDAEYTLDRERWIPWKTPMLGQM